MDSKKLAESLSINEIKIIPYLTEKKIEDIEEKSQLDKVSVLRALDFLERKEIVKVSHKEEKIVDLDNNGILYQKSGLPERKMMNLLVEKNSLPLSEAKKLSDLTDEEFKASIGILKGKNFVELKNGRMILNTNKEHLSKKTPEELLLDSLPLNQNELTKEQSETFNSLQKRKNLVKISDSKTTSIQITDLGKEMMKLKLREDMIEQITPELLKKDLKGKKFRRYDVTAFVPEIHGGKRHFVNQSIDYGRKIWTEMGFKEMEGSMIDSSFWVFDALFTPQDHSAREMQDTFFINKKTELTDKKIVKAVKDSHEGNIKELKSKGWQYQWDEEEAKKLLLRTHTTSLSARTLASLKKEDLPAKFFAIGKVFRNETIDWKHGFEFYQTEGIVVDRNANFRHLLGYLKQFYKKMGFEKVRFRPGFFAYTEPSVEIEVFHPERKQWLEFGGAGIFRPEVTVALFGESIPVLAWGQGFDRIITDYYKIKDLRELYKNNLNQLRKIKFWIK